MDGWKMMLPWQVEKVITMLNERGYEAYAVGGCVRDAILGKQPHDYDVATSATPDVVGQLFVSYKVIEIGVLHGTVAVIVDHLPIEITTYRIESAYREHRWPSSVSFTTSLYEDMNRRDFTINALAYHPELGLIDYFHGMNDLHAGIIRAVGDASARFEEDALRILRCLRFASVLGFVIEENTAHQAKEKACLLEVIAWERKSEEFMKLLGGEAFSKQFSLFPDVLGFVLPELQRLLEDDQYSRVIASMYAVVVQNELLGMARFVILLASLQLMFTEISVVCRRLRFPRNLEKKLVLIASVLLEINVIDEPHDIRVKHWLRTLGVEPTKLMLACAQAMKIFGVEEANQCVQLMDSILLESQPYLISHLAITGNDLIRMGMIPGPQIGGMLEALLEKVISNKIANEKDVLLNVAAQWHLGDGA